MTAPFGRYAAQFSRGLRLWRATLDCARSRRDLFSLPTPNVLAFKGLELIVYVTKKPIFSRVFIPALFERRLSVFHQRCLLKSASPGPRAGSQRQPARRAPLRTQSTPLCSLWKSKSHAAPPTSFSLHLSKYITVNLMNSWFFSNKWLVLATWLAS